MSFFFLIKYANVDGRELFKNEVFLKDTFRKSYADKGFFSDKLHKLMFVDWN
jgi:hypothetical protein